jgi:hypothetical protein
VHSYFDLQEITGVTNESDDLMNHLIDMVLQTRPDASHHFDGLAALMISPINIAADDPTEGCHIVLSNGGDEES